MRSQAREAVERFVQELSYMLVGLDRETGGVKAESNFTELEMNTELEVEYHPTDADWNILERLRDLCPPPELALRVIEMARDPDVDLPALSHHIELDPTLTAQLLRTVNGAQFGLSVHVNSVAKAVSLLGLKSLRLLTTAFGMLSPFSVNLPRALYQLYWRRSLTVALAARELALTSTDDSCLAFTAGLLSEIGVLALAQVEGPTYHAMYQELQARPMELIAAENLSFGTDHVRVGGLILGNFGLESQIVQAILSLNEPDTSPARSLSPLAGLLAMAQELTGLLTLRHRDQWSRFRERLLRDFRVDTDRLLDLISHVGAELHDWGKLFKLDVPQLDEAKFRETAALALVELSMESAVDLSVFESVFGSRGHYAETNPPLPRDRPFRA